MLKNTFVDELTDISVTGALVRLEFAVRSPARDGNGPGEVQPTDRLIMPIESFLRMHEALGRMIGVMVDKGTLRKKDDAPAAGGTLHA